MDSIQRVLRRASRRLFIIDLLNTLMVTLTIACAAVIVVLLIERLFGVLVPWMQVLIGAGVLGIVSAVVWSFLRRARGLALARELDERAHLKDSLSTALCVASLDNPWSRAVVETARERALRVVVRDATPITTPRLAPVPAASLVAFGLLWVIVPQMDLFGRKQERVDEKHTEAAVVEARHEVEEMRDNLDELLEKAGVEMEEEDSQLEEKATPTDIRLAAIRELTSIEDQLKEQKESVTAKQAVAMRQMMRRLRTPGPGPMDAMSKAMAQGNFDQAQKALQELARKLASGELTAEQKAQAAAQMKDLAKQLEKLAAMQDALKEQLKEAGLTDEQAQAALQNPESLQAAMDKLKTLTPAQKQALMNAIKAQQGAAGKCQGMAQKMAQMGEAMKAGNMSAMQGAAGQMGAMLSQSEMLQGELAALEASLGRVGACMGTLAGQCAGEGKGLRGPTGPWRAGDSNKLGNGSGGPGRGHGVSPEGVAADYTIHKEKATVHRTQGPIIGQRWIYGKQIRGESREAFAQAVRAAGAAAAEAIESTRIEPEYEDAVKAYFTTLEKRANSDSDQTTEGEQTDSGEDT